MTPVPRLVRQFIPKHYQLSLDLKRQARSFTGSVAITGTKVSDTKPIALHSKDLHISSITVDGAVATFSHTQFDGLVIDVPGLKAGEHTVTITFSGSITDGMHGLYPCYYTEDGEAKELLATQFESHHAREVFPCLDEPEAKATFDVTLHTERDIAVIGNMPIAKQSHTQTSLVTQFETTPRMSTYLLAFVAGDLQSISATSKSGVITSIWATKTQPVASMEFALDVATQALDFFNEYFGTPYPLPKADHVALPDFSAGAMENWGLITYREIALLADTSASLDNKQLVAAVIAHELSHQWFGNLVTMRWWDDLWLNESFASLMEYVALDALFPEWQFWEHFTAKESLPAYQRDGIPGVQAIKTDVQHPDEISSLFDPAIVYAKGAKVLRMLRAYIGDEDFRKGLMHYFAKNAYQNTAGSDLWEAFKAVSGKDVTGFMASWIEQAGFPVVQANLTDNQLVLHQQQFSITGSVADDKIWPIPLNGSQIAIQMLMSNVDQTVVVETTAPILLNSGDTAHFITHYSDNLRRNITQLIRQKTLTTVDRLQFLSHSLLLSRGGLLSTGSLVPLLSAYEDERDAPVWNSIGGAYALLQKCVPLGSSAERSLDKLLHTLALPAFERLGLSEQSEDMQNELLTRRRVVGLLVATKEPSVVKAAQDAFNPDLSHINSNVRAAILEAVVQQAEQEQIDYLLKEYRTTVASDLKRDIMLGLTSTEAPSTIELLLDTLTTTAIRPQDVVQWFGLLMRNPAARTMTWQWMQSQWQWIEAAFVGDKSYDRFPSIAGNSLCTKEELDQYMQFFAPLAQKQAALQRIVAMGSEEIRARIKWLERDAPGVIAALERS